MTILATLSFKISKTGEAGGTGAPGAEIGQYPTGGGIGTGGGSGYTPPGSSFFPPSVASPYFVPTPVYGPQPGATTSGGVIIQANDPQGFILQVDNPTTAIPGSAFNLITRFTHKHTGSAAYSIRVKFPQIGIDSTSPPTTVSQNGVGVIISTVTVPGESATSPIPSILSGTIELIRTQPAGTYPTGTTTEAMQVLDDSRVVTITKIGSTIPLPVPIPTNCCPAGQYWDKCTCKCEVSGAVTCQAINCPTCGSSPPPIPIPQIPGPAALVITPESASTGYVNITLNGTGFYANERVVVSYLIAERTGNQFLFVAELTTGTGGTFAKPIAIKIIGTPRPQLVRFRSQGRTSGRQAEASFTPLI